MKKISVFCMAVFFLFQGFSQVVETVNPSPLEDFATGYITDTEKVYPVNDQLEGEYLRFFKFDLSAIPKHATITAATFTHQFGYVSIPDYSGTCYVFNLDIDPVSAEFGALKDSLENPNDTVGVDQTTYSGNYGGVASSAELNSKGVDFLNQYLSREWMTLTVRFDQGEWSIIGHKEFSSAPGLDITYMPGVPVSAISFQGTDTIIDTDAGSLQLNVDVMPDTATIDSVIWSVDDDNLATIDVNGMLTATGNSNGVVEVTATAWDGSGVDQIIDITLTNQEDIISVEPNETAYIVKTYPNPVQDLLYLETGLAKCVASLVSAQGKQLFIRVLEIGSNTIDCSKIDPGVYLLQISSASKVIAVKKIIVN